MGGATKTNVRRSCEGRKPELRSTSVHDTAWIPAFAGMTNWDVCEDSGIGEI